MQIKYQKLVVLCSFTIGAANPIGEYPNYPSQGATTTAYPDGRRHTTHPAIQPGSPPPYSSAVNVHGNNNVVIHNGTPTAGWHAALNSPVKQKVLVGLATAGVLYLVYRRHAQAIAYKLNERYTISDIDMTLNELRKMDPDTLVKELLDSFTGTQLTTHDERTDAAYDFLVAAGEELMLLERYIIIAERDAHYHLGPLAVTSLELYDAFLDRSDRLHYCMQIMEKWLNDQADLESSKTH